MAANPIPPVRTPTTKRIKFDFFDPFIVNVSDGATARVYLLPKNLLTSYSHFFRAACNRMWQEGQKKSIEITERDPKYFDIYVQLLYTGQVITHELELDPKTNLSKCKEACHDIIQTWLLADMLMDIRSKNALMNALFAIVKLDDDLGLPCTPIMYSSTIARSPLRRLLVDFACARFDEPATKSTFRRMPRQFLHDVVDKLVGMHTLRLEPLCPFELPVCVYHEHDEENPVCEEGRELDDDEWVRRYAAERGWTFAGDRRA